MADIDPNPLSLAVPLARGYDAYETQEPMPKGLSENGEWAWSLGWRLHQHLKLNGFSDARQQVAR